MAEVPKFAPRPPDRELAETRARAALSRRDGAHLLTAVTLMDDARATFLTFANTTRNLALRQTFTLLSRMMAMCAEVIRDKMVDPGQTCPRVKETEKGGTE